MNWYNTLSIHQKINAKGCFGLLCGVGFSEIGFLFNLRQRMNLMQEKLIYEGMLEDKRGE